MPLPDWFHLGTSSWTAPSWSGPFYPPGVPASEYLQHYSQHFSAVEIDSTWYRPPTANTVAGWDRATPPEFRFAAKVPRVVTHEKVLVDCRDDLLYFADLMRPLGPKLGALLLQFPYFRRDVFGTVLPFLERLEPFLAELPADLPWALEIRNKAWLGKRLADALRAHRVALAWIAHPWMPGPVEMGKRPELITADFLYVRWLGDRHAIEEMTTDWTRQIWNRSAELREWARVLGEVAGRGGVSSMYGFHNNHYSGCAYESAAEFAAAWGA